MTSSEKAQELIDKFSIVVTIKTTMDSIPTCINDLMHPASSKRCALIAVTEIEQALINSGIEWDAKYWDDVKGFIQAMK